MADAISISKLRDHYDFSKGKRGAVLPRVDGEFTVVIEAGPTSYGATVPALPGSVAVAETREEVEALIREAIEMHLRGLREDGEAI